ncbi:MAG TPA: hypothetical protein PKO19_09565 [Chitinophagales bacterium]|nr:hypothetical protein [Chitinophagales bacterium]HNK98347.1 hypothetical protein [Chitinophagales bacterium]
MIDKNIRIAATPPGDFYLGEDQYALVRKKYSRAVGIISAININFRKQDIYIP